MRSRGARAFTLKLRLMVAAAATLVGLCGLLALALVGVLADAQRAGADGAGAGGLRCAASPAGRDEIPAELLTLYVEAAAAHGLGGQGVFVLAAINRIETDFGRNQGPSSAGAVGWMQFMPATWARHGVDGNGDGNTDPGDPADAIPAAAAYLRAAGAPGDWYRAIFAYNHADWYVRDVLELADRYRGACTTHPAAEPVGEGRLAWPTAERTITGVFGEPRPGRRHSGLDIAAPHGAPILAAAAGTVVLARGTATSGGYGNYLCLQHGLQLRTCYAHLSAIYVRAGQVVAQGQVVGACGNTGHSFGAHLHLEVRVTPEWGPVNPADYLES